MKKILYISGMHCPSCDILIREIIYDTDGVQLMDLTSSGVVTCVYTDEKSLLKAKEAIIAQGYTISDTLGNGFSKKIDLKELFVLFLCGLGLRLLLYNVDISTYVSSLGTDGTFGYGEIILLGFIASLSTCLALVGGFVLMRGSLSGSQTKPMRTVLFHQGLFQIGRLAGYAAGGFILGSIGSTFVFSPHVNGIINLLVSILLLIIGWNMLLILPVRIPMRGGGKRFMDLLQRFSTKKRGGFFVGALTFFLPCGFSQLAQINALSTGSAIEGGILLFLFALGTFPVLFILGLTGNRFQMNPLSFTAKLIGTILVVLSLFLIQNAFNLLGWF